MRYTARLLQALTVSALILAPCAASAQTEVSARTTLGQSEKTIYVGLWENDSPRGRLDISSDEARLGLYIPPSKNMWKLLVSTKKEGGVYFQKIGTDGLDYAAGYEYLDGIHSLEVHGGFRADSHNRTFLGYANTGGASIFTVGDIIDFWKLHFAAAFSRKTEKLDLPFGGKNQVVLYFSTDKYAKFWYRDDGTQRKFGGYLKFGQGSENRYNQKSFDIERPDIIEQTLRHSAGEGFDVPLNPVNTHLSDQGTFAISPSYLTTKTGSQSSVEAFYNHRNIVGGYRFSREKKNGSISNSHAVSAGFNRGRIKVLGSWDTRKGFSVSAFVRPRSQVRK